MGGVVITKIDVRKGFGYANIYKKDKCISMLWQEPDDTWGFLSGNEADDLVFTWQELQIIVDKLRELNELGASHG